MQYTLLILLYAFSVITHKQSDKLATIQRIKCHAYDRDGAVCSFSQDLKISTCLHIYIYIIFDSTLYMCILFSLVKKAYYPIGPKFVEATHMTPGTIYICKLPENKYVIFQP